MPPISIPVCTAPGNLEGWKANQASICCSTVISAFAIVILSVIGGLFRSKHHSLSGHADDPVDGPAVASTIFIAVFVYIVSPRDDGTNSRRVDGGARIAN